VEGPVVGPAGLVGKVAVEGDAGRASRIVAVGRQELLGRPHPQHRPARGVHDTGPPQAALLQLGHRRAHGQLRQRAGAGFARIVREHVVVAQHV